MKSKTKAGWLASILFILSHASGADVMPTTYMLTITNGSAMPISPISIYTTNGQAALTRVGMAPSAGFVQLCQTGNPALRIQELGMQMGVTFKAQTMGPLQPGESRTLEVQVQDPLTQSLHFEAMYGKTKDVCAVSQIGSHSLYALKQHVTSEVIGKDNVLQTGAFSEPMLPAGRNYLDMNLCSAEMNAVSCLRSLSMANMGPAKVRFFSSYLSSVQMLLENRYGSAEVQSLILPSSGAVEYRLTLKH